MSDCTSTTGGIASGTMCAGYLSEFLSVFLRLSILAMDSVIMRC